MNRAEASVNGPVNGQTTLIGVLPVSPAKPGCRPQAADTSMETDRIEFALSEKQWRDIWRDIYGA